MYWFFAWDFYKVEQTLGGFSIFSQDMKPRASPHASINTNSSPKPSLFITVNSRAQDCLPTKHNHCQSVYQSCHSVEFFRDTKLV